MQTISPTATRPPRSRRAIRRGTTVRLVPESLISVKCLRGAIWATSDQSSEDVILKPGDAFSWQESAVIVLEGLQDSVIELRLL
jgi:hypothetical protein